MPLVTRTGKGSKLTIAEMDGNLTYLQSASFGDSGSYSQTFIGTGAVLNLTNMSSDPSPLVDGAVGIYTVSPTGGVGSGLQLSLRVIEDRGSNIFDFANSTIIDGGLGYVDNDEVEISSDDVGGTLNEPIILYLGEESTSITKTSTITVTTGSITFNSTALYITGSVSAQGEIAAGTLSSQNIFGSATLETINVNNTQGGSTAVTFENLPTSDPQVAGQLWVDAGNSYVLKVSQGL